MIHLEPIRTARLLLRAPRLDDAQAIFDRYAQLPEVTRYVSWTPHVSVEETRAFLESTCHSRRGSEFVTWVIADPDDDSPLGMIGLEPKAHSAEMGYVLAPRCWGRGYATEAARAVIADAFLDPTIYRVSATCDVDNAASARVLVKAGMEREGILRRYMRLPNISDVPRDMLSFSIVR